MSEKLTGLELRIATLQAAGWTVSSYNWEGLTLYTLNNWEGEPLAKLNATEADAWQHAPAVESSVDAALEWLKLDNERYWKLIGPNYGSYYVHIAEELDSTWVSLAGSFDRQGFAPAMCRAFLAWKAGA